MALQVRKGSGAVLPAVIAAINELRQVAASSWGVVHADVTSTNSGDWQVPSATPALFIAPPATDLQSLVILCAELAARHAHHTRDERAHRAADVTNTLAHPAPVTLADAQAFLTDAKAKWNAHQTQAGVHYTADASDTITAPDATDLASAIALANTYRAVYATHIQNALFGASIDLIDP